MASCKRLSDLPVMHGALRLLADIAFPPRCPTCRSHVSADGNFCTACFAKLRMISDPLCAHCGVPFVVAVEENTHCPACLESPPAFDRARAVMVYDAISAPLISALKFHDQWAGMARMVQMMLRAGHELIEGADMIVPVPLHWRRLAQRKYNQSALLAYGVSAHTGIPCQPGMLRRIRPTTPQMKLDRATRLKNVTRAFDTPLTMRGAIAGKHILLIDDVVTTGATAEACARTLKKAGAAQVRVLALARTVRE